MALAAPAFAVFAGLFLCYTAWIMRSIWLNAGNVDRPAWGSMARVLTIGWTINAVVVSLSLAKFDNEPLQFLG